MQSYKTTRYRCDFCGKTGGHAGHMRKHEKFCTANPNRRCRMCRIDPDPTNPGTQTDIARLIRILGKGDETGMRNLRSAANGCPACMLAAIRQSNFLEWQDKGRTPWSDFNYADESRAWFAEVQMGEEYFF